jgi:hypothetical protein
VSTFEVITAGGGAQNPVWPGALEHTGKHGEHPLHMDTVFVNVKVIDHLITWGCSISDSLFTGEISCLGEFEGDFI